jgi:putative PIN family toxin of toxin-antitoxin system
MIKIVPDTNVIISGMLGGHGNPRKLLNLSLAKKIILYGCEESFSEFCDVINRPKLSNYLKRQLYTPQKIILDYKSIVKIVEPMNLLVGKKIAIHDRDDDIYFRIAKACGARIIISGDKKHVLAVEEYDNILVVPVSKFINSYSIVTS